jgi:hypothetical protein
VRVLVKVDSSGYGPRGVREIQPTVIDRKKPLWYRRYRGAAYLVTFATLVWTLVMVIPSPPFSYIPPIIVGGGPGVWLVLAYLLFIIVGIGGFGALSAFLTTVELHEGRTIDPRTMWPALILLSIGVTGSCLLLAVAGAVGGYAATFETSSGVSIDSLLSPYVNPITVFVLIAVVGACLAVVSMARARWPAP